MSAIVITLGSCLQTEGNALIYERICEEKCIADTSVILKRTKMH